MAHRTYRGVLTLQFASDISPAKSWPRVGIASRRYLGAKTRLLPFLMEAVRHSAGSPSSLADLMAGTGVVANAFTEADRPVLANDLLYSNHLALRCFLSETDLTPDDLVGPISALQELAPVAGYAAKNFGGAYFTLENAARIDAIRERIDVWARAKEISAQEEAALITSLLYATDKVAHTCGHYDAYRKAPLAHTPLMLRVPDFDSGRNAGNRIAHDNANDLVKRIAAEVIYLDPPYNSRQYSDTYHLIENLARWQKPKVFGDTRKMDRTALKSLYCGRNAAAKALDDLVQGAHCRFLLLSYNNMGVRGNDRSNARISDDDIMTILSRRGKVTVHKRTFNAFTTGIAVHSSGHEERLFVCEMTSKPSTGEARRTEIENLARCAP